MDKPVKKTDEKAKSEKGFTLQRIDELNLRAQASYLGRNTTAVKNETTTVLMGSVENKEVLPRTITVYGFSLRTAHEFMERVHQYYTEDSEGPILILVMSYGGEVDGLMGIVGTIETYPTIEFRTLVSGTAMSCGAALLSAGTKGKRYTLPHARVMVHKVSAGMWGNVDDNVNEGKETVRINDELFGILAKNTKHSVEAWMKTLADLEGARELYLSAEDALEIGLVDEIVADMSSIIPVYPIEEVPPDQLGKNQDTDQIVED